MAYGRDQEKGAAVSQPVFADWNLWALRVPIPMAVFPGNPRPVLKHCSAGALPLACNENISLIYKELLICERLRSLRMFGMADAPFYWNLQEF